MVTHAAETEGKQNSKIVSFTRRNFLNSAGAAAGGLIVAAGAGLFAGREAKAAVPEATPPLPWKYSKLDPLEAGKRGYQNYLAKGGWGSGAWLGVLSLLKEQVGYPYTMLPEDMFQHAAGGYGGQGTLCGSLGACASLINLVTFNQSNTHNVMITDLINWYAAYNHPTDEFDAIVHYPKQKRVVPGSPLCHVSVSTWSVANGATINSYERKDRCAKVAGKVAMQTVSMLNAYADGKWKPVAPGVSAKTGSCLECHGPGGDHNEQGMMECGLCHSQTPDHAG